MNSTLMILSPVWTPARIAAPSVDDRQKKRLLSEKKYEQKQIYKTWPAGERYNVKPWQTRCCKVTISKDHNSVYTHEEPVSQLHPKQRDLSSRQVIMRSRSDSAASSLKYSFKWMRCSQRAIWIYCFVLVRTFKLVSLNIKKSQRQKSETKGYV